MLVAVNKLDRAPRGQVLERLASVERTVDALGEADAEYFPVSATHGDGVDELLAAIVARLPEGPAYYPDDVVTDTPEALRVAELVREQLLARAPRGAPAFHRLPGDRMGMAPDPV